MTFLTPIYLLALTCPAVTPINSTKFPWNWQDAKVMASAEERCKYHFPLSPCLITFEKYAERDYRVKCGAKR